MLSNLTVRNFALVAELSISFHAGLTVITGESGAGKSILLDALSLVLGSRASRSQIRPGTSQCEVVAEFDISELDQSKRYLCDHQLLDETDPSRLVVRRIAGIDGRSRAWINSVSVNLGALRQLCAPLVEIHGQFAQQQLLSSSVQLEWLDDFIGDTDLIEKVQRHHESWQQTREAHQSAQESAQQAADRRELLTYQVAELDSLNLQPDEFEQTTRLFKSLSNLEQNKMQVAELYQNLEEQINPLVRRLKSSLTQIRDDNLDLQSTKDYLETVEINLEEAESSLQAYAEYLQNQNTSIDEVSARLDQIHDVARKHKIHPRDLQAHHDALRAELARLVVGKKEVEVLEVQLATQREEFLVAATELSDARRAHIPAFCASVIEVLNTLGMSDVDFQIEIHEEEHARGLERIEFLVSPNSKYAVTSLKETASGGEISRISLAILVIISQASKLPCLILDEADIGIGGTTADTLGRMLRRLGMKTQVVCVTHAPQVAALGQEHLQVYKSLNQDIEISRLDQSTRVEEIARMVGGREVNRKSREYAQTLLSEAVNST